MSTEKAPPSLDGALSRFSIFLEKNGLPERIVLVQGSDLIWANQYFWVRDRPQRIAWVRACEQYADGIQSGFGVLLHGFATLPDATVATVVFPRDADTAQRYLMPECGLKLSVLKNMRSARLVRNGARWWILSIRYRQQSQLFWNDCVELS